MIRTAPSATPVPIHDHPGSTPSDLDLLDSAIDAFSEPLLGEELRGVLVIVFYFVLQIPVLAFGVGSNIFNISVFALCQHKDSVTLAFTALSISDLGYVLVSLAMRVLGLLHIVFQVPAQVRLERLGVSNYIAYLAHIFQDASVMITVFVTVQKCCCVAIPHMFRDVFTPRRTVVTLFCLSLAMVFPYLPIYAGMYFKPVPVNSNTDTNSNTNTDTPTRSNDTILSLHKTRLFYRGRNLFWRIFNKIVLPYSSQAIILVCLVVMVIHLRKSAKFRSSAEVGVATTDKDTPPPATTTPTAGTQTGRLGYKERRAITAVAVVAAMYLVSTIPPTVLSYCHLLVPSFFARPRNESFLRLVNNSQNILTHVSASINTLVYLKYNSKYRNKARSICCGYFGKV